MSWTNLAGSAYETLTQSGDDITSAINSAGLGIAHQSVAALVLGSRYRVSFDLTLNSGTGPDLRIADNAALTTGATVLSADMATGAHAYYFYCAGEAEIGFRNEDGQASNFEVANYVLVEVPAGSRSGRRVRRMGH